MTAPDGTEPRGPAQQSYDPNVLDLTGSRADVVWLRAMGVTNVPERLTALLAEVDRLTEALAAERSQPEADKQRARAGKAEASLSIERARVRQLRKVYRKLRRLANLSALYGSVDCDALDVEVLDPFEAALAGDTEAHNVPDKCVTTEGGWQ